MQIKLEGVIREIIGSGHRFVCLVRQQVELVLVVFYFLENWNNDGLDNSTRTRNLKPALRPAQHDAICRVLKIGLLSDHQRKIECQQKISDCFILTQLPRSPEKRQKKRGTEYRNKGRD